MGTPASAAPAGMRTCERYIRGGAIP
eukprot:COSAG05_NODE_17943_length_316_cov_1.184332_1_plen_25_part_10